MSAAQPVDGCSGCLTTGATIVVHPYAVLPVGTGARAFYHCHGCGSRWRTGWSAEALAHPCPGCAVCGQENLVEGDAA